MSSHSDPTRFQRRTPLSRLIAVAAQLVRNDGMTDEEQMSAKEIRAVMRANVRRANEIKRCVDEIRKEKSHVR